MLFNVGACCFCCCCSLRAQFAVDGVTINQLHGSDTDEQADKEILYFFPIEQTVALIKPDAYENKGELLTRIVMVVMVVVMVVLCSM